MVMQSHGMVALDNWQESHGTLREVMLTQSSGKPVFNEDFLPVGFEVVPSVVPVDAGLTTV
jgi:hypothetical protein